LAALNGQDGWSAYFRSLSRVLKTLPYVIFPSNELPK